MNAIIQPQGVESLMLSILLRGQTRACAQAFCRVEAAIWSCISKHDSAEAIGRCIERGICDECEDHGQSPPSRSLSHLEQCLSEAMSSMADPDTELMLAFCDDVMRFAATVWQSWQDGYDAGWEDHHRAQQDLSRLDS